MDKEKIVIFWFRRDLRLHDNMALAQAVDSGYRVLPIFIFDSTILEVLDDAYDRRVDYIQQALTAINLSLRDLGSALKTYHGTPEYVFQLIVAEYAVVAVYANEDYEPYARERDRAVSALLDEQQISFITMKDQVIFDYEEVLKPNGTPYTIYTPYARKWKSQLKQQHYASVPVRLDRFLTIASSEVHAIEALGFVKTDLLFRVPSVDIPILEGYAEQRDIPSMSGTTHLGIVLRFGTISIRECVSAALEHSDIWLSELIWREFFMQILFHFPQVEKRCFKPEYEFLAWQNSEEQFRHWCEGTTGYPMVDAGMRQLNATGWMHNRVRMIVASFLCKHLLIDWRWGEAYFASKLLDYELAANNGNWQWAAGCGCDAAPYFRIFNHTSQMQKFDPSLLYVRKWVPEYSEGYLPPIVEHTYAKDRALQSYKAALSEARSV